MSANSTLMQAYSQSVKLMGNQFGITVVGNSSDWAAQQFDTAIAEIKRIERLLTTFDENSQTNQVNRQAGIGAVKVDREVLELVKRAQAISAITDGAFDISYGSIDTRLWNFDTSMGHLPDPETAKALVHLIDYRNIELDEDDCTVFLKKKGMRIGFGGIGKGYAAEMAKKALVRAGVNSGIINASGDLCAWGQQEDGQPWTIGVAHPDFPDKAFSGLHISNLAVATSGNYEKYVWLNGKKYAHTIDPTTGFPVEGIKSVTIIASNAELADALTTPVMVMGVPAGLNMINQLSQVACIIIDEENKVYTTKNITCI